MDNLKEKKCIVCGEFVWWDDSKMPPACKEHTYVKVFTEYDKLVGNKNEKGNIKRKKQNDTKETK